MTPNPWILILLLVSFTINGLAFGAALQRWRHGESFYAKSVNQRDTFEDRFYFVTCHRRYCFS